MRAVGEQLKCVKFNVSLRSFVIASFAGKNSFLTGAVARFRRVKFIGMARILE
jgi:hypothetical protein